MFLLHLLFFFASLPKAFFEKAVDKHIIHLLQVTCIRHVRFTFTNKKYLHDYELANLDISAYFHQKKYPKKTILLHAGEVCRFEAFILKACLKSYFIDNESQEVILTFAPENCWVSNIASFQDQILYVYFLFI